MHGQLYAGCRKNVIKYLQLKLTENNNEEIAAGEGPD
jgi:hypothetical protein